jgi:O-antigen/teichoic acid export membrane protein
MNFIRQSDASTYVIVNIGTNLLFLVRSYVTMQVLEYRDLGLIAFLQMIILFVSMLHFGVINGAYRLVCSESDEACARIGDFVFTFAAILMLLIIALLLITSSFTQSTLVNSVTVCGVVAGLFTLLRNWLSVFLTAKIRLSRLNSINLWSAALSLLVLVFVPVAPRIACLAAVIIQPIAFVLFALITEPGTRPARFYWRGELARSILAAGFAMFLTGLLIQLNLQVERWYVVKVLGMSALGHLYLAILFTNLFQLVPTALDSLFLPRLVQAHAVADIARVRKEMRQFFMLISVYCLFVMLTMWAFAGPILDFILPRYRPDLIYVWIFLPGLLLFTLAGPLAMAFNVLIAYRTYYVAYSLGTLTIIIALGAAVLMGVELTLEQVTAAKSAAYLFMGVSILIGFLLVTRHHRQFRFLPLLSRPES